MTSTVTRRVELLKRARPAATWPRQAQRAGSNEENRCPDGAQRRRWPGHEGECRLSRPQLRPHANEITRERRPENRRREGNIARLPLVTESVLVEMQDVRITIVLMHHAQDGQGGHCRALAMQGSRRSGGMRQDQVNAVAVRAHNDFVLMTVAGGHKHAGHHERWMELRREEQAKRSSPGTTPKQLDPNLSATIHGAESRAGAGWCQWLIININ
jgi:hypothetical protein